MNDKPERKISLDLKIQGDSWHDIELVLNELADSIALHGAIAAIGTSLSAGASSSYVAEGRENLEQSAENYRAEHEAYAERATKEISGQQKRVMRSPEDFIERNIEIFLAAARKDRVFGVSYIQRLCRIGYNQACYTRDAMIKQGIIKFADDHAAAYEFVAAPGVEQHCPELRKIDDRGVADLVNALTKIALEHHDSQSLRQRIAKEISEAI